MAAVVTIAPIAAGSFAMDQRRPRGREGEQPSEDFMSGWRRTGAA